MPYTTVDVASLPKRPGRQRQVDMETANELYTLAQQDGQAVTDGETYPDQKSARAEANKAKRLIDAASNGEANVRTRVFATGDDAWQWSVQLVAEKPEKKGSKAKS